MEVFSQYTIGEIRNITADLMNEIYHGVSMEPHLQLITGEWLTHRSTNRGDGAKLDLLQRTSGGEIANAYSSTYRYSTSSHKAIVLSP